MGNIEKEKRTVELMIELYCKKKHGAKVLCSDCNELKNYAFARLDNCLYGNEKPACKDCKVHCYKLEMRNRIKIVMRYVGPRMFYLYPIDFILHKMKRT